MKMTLCVFSLFVAAFAVSADEVAIVRDGAPAASIVVGGKPVKAARFAAAELQHVVELVTGAKLPIVAEAPAGALRIFVGCGTDEGFVREEYAVRFRDGDVILAGHDAADHGAFDYGKPETFPPCASDFHATEYAVYDFLEKWFGARFYSFGDRGIAFRPRRTVTVPRNGGYRRAPSMQDYRVPYFESGYKEELKLDQRDIDLLQHRWRANEMTALVNHSTLGIFYRYWKRSKVAERAKLFIEHRPDYFAKGYEGKMAPNSLRKWDYPGDVDLPPQLCATSEGPIEYFADEAVRMAHGERIEASWASRKPMEGYRFHYPIQEDDNGYWCKCARCLADPKLKDYRYRHFDWCNRILRKAKERDPEIGAATLAYGTTLPYPDGVPLEEGLGVMMCLGVQSWFHPFVYAYQHGAYRDWVDHEKGKRPLTVWLYYINPENEARLVHKYGKFFPLLYARRNGVWFREFLKDGISGWFGEINPRYQLLEAYVAAMMSYDASVDLDALLDEHYALYYGAAGAAMKEFSDTLERESFDIDNYSEHIRTLTPRGSYLYCLHTERENWHLGSRERVERLDAIMDRAKAAAATPLEKERVAFFNACIWDQAKEGLREHEERVRRQAIPLPEVEAVRVDGANGDAAKVAFGDAVPSVRFRSRYNDEVRDGGRVRLAADGDFLYVEYSEPGDSALAHVTQANWDNDFECLLSVNGDEAALHLSVKPADGSVVAFRRLFEQGAPHVDRVEMAPAESRLSKDGWTVRLAVPLARIPGFEKGADRIRANFFRARLYAGNDPTTAWSPVFCESFLDANFRMGVISLPKTEGVK